METKIKIPDAQLFYEINFKLSTIKSLLVFLDSGINHEIIIEDTDLSNITTLLKELVEKTSKSFQEIELLLNI